MAFPESIGWEGNRYIDWWAIIYSESEDPTRIDALKLECTFIYNIYIYIIPLNLHADINLKYETFWVTQKGDPESRLKLQRGCFANIPCKCESLCMFPGKPEPFPIKRC